MRALLLIIIVFQFSCVEDDFPRTIFEGDYIGFFNCIGELDNDNGDEFEIEITRIGNNSYELEIEDDFYLTAFLENGILVLPQQDIERLFGLEFVSINGTISILDEINLNFDFYIDSADGETTCVTILELD